MFMLFIKLVEGCWSLLFFINMIWKWKVLRSSYSYEWGKDFFYEGWSGI